MAHRRGITTNPRLTADSDSGQALLRAQLRPAAAVRLPAAVRPLVRPVCRARVAALLLPPGAEFRARLRPCPGAAAGASRGWSPSAWPLAAPPFAARPSRFARRSAPFARCPPAASWPVSGRSVRAAVRPLGRAVVRGPPRRRLAARPAGCRSAVGRCLAPRRPARGRPPTTVRSRSPRRSAACPPLRGPPALPSSGRRAVRAGAGRGPSPGGRARAGSRGGGRGGELLSPGGDCCPSWRIGVPYGGLQFSRGVLGLIQ